LRRIVNLFVVELSFLLGLFNMRIRQAREKDLGAQMIRDISSLTRIPENLRITALSCLLNPYFVVSEGSGGVKGFCFAMDSSLFWKVGYLQQDKTSLSRGLPDEDSLYLNSFGAKEPRTLEGERVLNELLDWTVDAARTNNLRRIFSYFLSRPSDEVSLGDFLLERGFLKRDEVSGMEGNLGYYELNL
jgi:hypothetical protein